MDPRSGIAAADIVNQYPAAELARIFFEFGEERNSRKIAREIEQVRGREPFRTTRQLAGLIERLTPARGQRAHPATRVFQALRIQTNQELQLLRQGLQTSWSLLRTGGRLAVISFHSLEDRIVKEFGRALTRDYRFEGTVDIPELRSPVRREARWVHSKPQTPTPGELAENPRARSARLRVLEKI